MHKGFKAENWESAQYCPFKAAPMGTEVPLLTLSPHSLMSWGEKCVKQKLLLTGSFCPCCFLVTACCGTGFSLAQMAKWRTAQAGKDLNRPLALPLV